MAMWYVCQASSRELLDRLFHNLQGSLLMVQVRFRLLCGELPNPSPTLKKYIYMFVKNPLS